MLTRNAIAAVRRVALYPRNVERFAEPFGVAIRTFQKHGVDVWVPQDAEVGDHKVERFSSDAIPEGLDLMMAIGGDGTLLRACRLVMHEDVPVVGVNLGDLGFLAAYGAEQVAESVTDAVAGSLAWESRLIVRVEVRRANGETAEQFACNDVYIRHGSEPRMIHLAARTHGEPMAEYRADGVIVSTPMGSTAYNLAAGGPIVDAGTHTLIITPVCPHSLTHRPVVTDATGPLSFRYEGPDEAGPATLAVDGQWTTELRRGDEVILGAAERSLRLVPPSATVFQVLSSKLGWSGPARRGP